MTNTKFHKLFEGEPRKPESKISQKEMDIAASIQKVIEEVIIKYSKHALNICNTSNLCLAGGVALNCVANGKIVSNGVTENIWIQPASGDAGGSIGSALYYHNIESGLSMNSDDIMKGSYLGPSYTNNVVISELKKLKEYIKFWKKMICVSLLLKKLLVVK